MWRNFLKLKNFLKCHKQATKQQHTNATVIMHRSHHSALGYFVVLSSFVTDCGNFRRELQQKNIHKYECAVQGKRTYDMKVWTSIMIQSLQEFLVSLWHLKLNRDSFSSRFYLADLTLLIIANLSRKKCWPLTREGSTTGNDQFNIPLTRRDDQMFCSQLCRYTRISLGILNEIFKKKTMNPVKSLGQRTNLIQCLFQPLGTILPYTGCAVNPKTTSITLQLILFKPFSVSSLVKEQIWHGSPFHSPSKNSEKCLTGKRYYTIMWTFYLMFSFHIRFLEHQTCELCGVFAKVYPPHHLK